MLPGALDVIDDRTLASRATRTRIHNAMIALGAHPAPRTVRMTREDRLETQALLAHMATWLSIGIAETCRHPGEFPQINTAAAVIALRKASRFIAELGPTNFDGPVSMSRQLHGTMTRWCELDVESGRTERGYADAV